eukprot:c20293_g1_i3.p1 GENE.c20293_g1_i3~~c20293_g1_i3.p1  ORF type:complete len:533 (+),score=197.42 c20293_g1_i3:41-1600(+)
MRGIICYLFCLLLISPHIPAAGVIQSESQNDVGLVFKNSEIIKLVPKMLSFIKQFFEDTKSNSEGHVAKAKGTRPLPNGDSSQRLTTRLVGTTLRAAEETIDSTGEAIESTAKTVGKEIESTAKTAGKEIVSTAKTVGNGIVSAAETVGDTFDDHVIPAITDSFRIASKAISNFFDSRKLVVPKTSFLSIFAAGFGVIVAIILAVFFFQAHSEKIDMWESEKLISKYRGSFSRYWKDLSIQKFDVRKRWIEEECMLAQDFTPKPEVSPNIPQTTGKKKLSKGQTEKIETEKEKEQKKTNELPTQNQTELPSTIENVPEISRAKPVEEILKQKYESGNGEVPLSMNGVVPPSFQATKPRDFLQTQLDDIFKLHLERSKRGKVLEQSGVTSFLETMEGSQLPSQIEKDNAELCWNQLKELVLNVRDLRRWRLKVTTALHTLAVAILIASIYQLLSYFLGPTISAEYKCDTQKIENNHELISCMEEYFQTCRLSCSDKRYFRYEFCYHSADSSYWIPISVCP